MRSRRRLFIATSSPLLRAFDLPSLLCHASGSPEPSEADPMPSERVSAQRDPARRRPASLGESKALVYPVLRTPDPFPLLQYDIDKEPNTLQLVLAFAYAAIVARTPGSLGVLPDDPQLSEPAQDTAAPTYSTSDGDSQHGDDEVVNARTRSRALQGVFQTMPDFDSLVMYLVGETSTYPPSLESSLPLRLHTSLRYLRERLYVAPFALQELDDGPGKLAGVSDKFHQYSVLYHADACEQRVSNAASGAAYFPTLYAFHGSALENWYTILRDGFNIDRVVNQRFYGDGIYSTVDGEIALGTYAKAPAKTMHFSSLGARPKHVVGLVELRRNSISCLRPDFVSVPTDARLVYLLVEYYGDAVSKDDVVVRTAEPKKPLSPEFVLRLGADRVWVPATVR